MQKPIDAQTKVQLKIPQLTLAKIAQLGRHETVNPLIFTVFKQQMWQWPICILEKLKHNLDLPTMTCLNTAKNSLTWLDSKDTGHYFCEIL